MQVPHNQHHHLPRSGPNGFPALRFTCVRSLSWQPSRVQPCLNTLCSHKKDALVLSMTYDLTRGGGIFCISFSPFPHLSVLTGSVACRECLTQEEFGNNWLETNLGVVCLTIQSVVAFVLQCTWSVLLLHLKQTRTYCIQKNHLHNCHDTGLFWCAIRQMPLSSTRQNKESKHNIQIQC